MQLPWPREAVSRDEEEAAVLVLVDESMASETELTVTTAWPGLAIRRWRSADLVKRSAPTATAISADLVSAELELQKGEREEEQALTGQWRVTTQCEDCYDAPVGLLRECRAIVMV